MLEEPVLVGGDVRVRLQPKEVTATSLHPQNTHTQRQTHTQMDREVDRQTDGHAGGSGTLIHLQEWTAKRWQCSSHLDVSLHDPAKPVI